MTSSDCVISAAIPASPSADVSPDVSPDASPNAKAERDALVRQHMPLVGHLVREAHSRVPGHVDRDDLMGTGLAALVVAARSWEPERGVPFARYASIRVRGAIVDELRSMDWASRSVRRRARELDETRNRLAAELGRVPDESEISHATGLSPRELAANAEDVARSSVMSLQGFGDRDVDDLISHHSAPADALIEQRERLAYLQDAVATLPERLRTVVEGWFLADRPMAEIAEELGVTESRVSQLRAEALVLLREAMHRALDPELATPHARPDGCAARRRESYFAEVAAHRTFRERLAAPAVAPVAQIA